MLVAVFLSPIWLLLFLASLPYTLYFFSANWGMRPVDMPPVQVYLDHFETLYPELFAFFKATHQTVRAGNMGRPSWIGSWPSKRKTTVHHLTWVTAKNATWIFSQAAGLFGMLETAGWERRILWTFLRYKVEQSGRVNQQQKEAFTAVMEKMCSHHLWHELRVSFHKFLHYVGIWVDKTFQDQNRLMPLGIQTVLVEANSMNWLLRPGTFLVPNDPDVQMRLRFLSEFKMWGRVVEDADLENGIACYWQLVDLRGKE